MFKTVLEKEEEGGIYYRAIAGDFIVGMTQTLGINGIIADGVVRDMEGIKQLDYPVFCKGTTVAASGKAGTGEVNVPISCEPYKITSHMIQYQDE